MLESTQLELQSAHTSARVVRHEDREHSASQHKHLDPHVNGAPCPSAFRLVGYLRVVPLLVLLVDL